MDQFVIYVLVGFLAQLIDGSMGMAYGLSCSTFLRSMGVPSLISTACIHIAEVFTTFFSGVMHFKLGNINKYLFYRLSVMGVFGGVLGIIILQYNLLPALDYWIDIYLLLMGFYILSKAFIKNKYNQKEGYSYVSVIGFFGGLLDAIGGGGWGPIVTTNLLMRSKNPREVIGSVNASEFFVTIVQSLFFIVYGLTNIQQYIIVLVGLIFGGIIAAPLAAYLVHKIKARQLYFMVGLVIIILNSYLLFK